MNKRFHYVLLAILLVILSLAGCGSNSKSQQETKKETKTVEVTAKADNKKEQEIKDQTSQDVAKTKTVVAPVEKKDPQPAAEKTESGQNPQPAQKSVTTAKPATPTTTTSKNTATSTGTTTSSTTTSTATKTTTNATTNATTKTTTKTTQTAPPPAPKPATVVTLSIVGPKDRGTILSATKIKMNDGDTIFDVIKRANVVVDSSGSGATAYIEGIDNIYEFDYGAKSGWVFKHNGVSITKSIGVIKVKAGDRIECYYTE